MRFNYIQKILSHWYSSLAVHITRHPLYFIILPIILSSILATGIMKVKYCRNSDYLFTAKSGRSKIDQIIMERYFPINSSENFDYLRLTEIPLTAVLMIEPKDGGNVFRKDVYDDMMKADGQVKNITFEYKGKFLRYKDICAKSMGVCVPNAGLKLAPYAEEIAKGNYLVKFPAHLDPVTYYTDFYSINLGGVILDKKGYITFARGVRLMYPIDISNEEKRKLAEEWRKVYLKEMIQNNYEHISVNALMSTAVNDELSRLTEYVLPFCPIVVAVVLIFSMASSIDSTWVRSKPWLGVCACISAGLALMASFGLSIYCGVEYADVTIALPFLILGIEVDDAYVLIAAWRRTNLEDGVEKRMQKVYSEAAISITITSATNFFSFCVGLSTPYPVIHLFCIYAAIAVFFTFAYQITFFGGALALSGIREERSLYSDTFHEIQVSGKIQKVTFPNERRKDFIMMKMFRDYLGNLLVSTKTKCFVLLAFVINLAISGWGFSLLKEGLEITDVFYRDSNLTIGFNDYYQYFTQYPFALSVVINQPMDYSDPKVQSQLNELVKNVTSLQNVASEEWVISWLKYFKIIANSSVGAFTFRGYNLSNKVEFVEALKDVFLNLAPARAFRKDIKFNRNGTEIIASRFLFACKDITSKKVESNLLSDVRRLEKESSLPIIVYSYLFPFYEEILLIRSLIFQVAWATALLLVGIFFLFLPSLKHSACVAVTIVSSIFSTVCYMALWNVKMDMLSTIVLIVSVGFSINYPAHMSFAFLTSTEWSKDDRMKEALHAVGWPIVQGTLSTIAAVAVLAWQHSYIIQVFFKIVTIIALQVAFHSMFALPVMLNMVDILSKRQKSNDANSLAVRIENDYRAESEAKVTPLI